jgi:hypothetical protein
MHGDAEIVDVHVVLGDLLLFMWLVGTARVRRRGGEAIIMAQNLAAE